VGRPPILSPEDRYLIDLLLVKICPSPYKALEHEAGGFNQHGLGRCTAQGYIAGKNAAAE
jgi:hypothetical protein